MSGATDAFGMNQPSSPFIEDSDAIILARLLNKAAKSFDPSSLTLEQAFVLHLLLDRIMSALWNEYGAEFLQLYRLAMNSSYNDTEEDSDEGSES